MVCLTQALLPPFPHPPLLQQQGLVLSMFFLSLLAPRGNKRMEQRGKERDWPWCVVQKFQTFGRQSIGVA